MGTYPKVIGLCGPAGSGKDTVADYLSASFGYYKFGFSYPLKELVCEQFGLWLNRINDLKYKETPIPRIVGPNGRPRTPREILQIIGTDGFRAVQPDFWTNRAIRTITTILRAGYDGVVVPDVRFPNEARALRENFQAEIWLLEREGRTPQTSASAHPSEEGWKSIVPDLSLHAADGDLVALRGLVFDHMREALYDASENA